MKSKLLLCGSILDFKQMVNQSFSQKQSNITQEEDQLDDSDSEMQDSYRGDSDWEMKEQIEMDCKLQWLLKVKLRQLEELKREEENEKEKINDFQVRIRYHSKLISQKDESIQFISKTALHNLEKQKCLLSQIRKEFYLLKNTKNIIIEECQLFQRWQENFLISIAQLSQIQDEFQTEIATLHDELLEVKEKLSTLYNFFHFLKLKGRIRIVCRIRPLKENEGERLIKTINPFQLSLPISGSSHNGGVQLYSFMKVFGETSNQKDIFQDLNFFLQSAMTGQNVCVFTYGPTGSGKTWTMFGNMKANEDKGIVPRSIEQVCKQLEGYQHELKVSIVEIYNSKIKYLTNSFTKEINQIQVPSSMTSSEAAEYLIQLLTQANKQRQERSTLCNFASSRSHLIFTLQIAYQKQQLVCNPLPNKEPMLCGSLTLVDLAGSENSNLSGATGEALKEASFINSSLQTLSQVIRGIKRGDDYIPYRNSPLTQYLKNFLTPTSKTMMILNISPCQKYYHQNREAVILSSTILPSNKMRMSNEKRNDGKANKASKECPQTEKKIFRSSSFSYEIQKTVSTLSNYSPSSTTSEFLM